MEEEMMQQIGFTSLQGMFGKYDVALVPLFAEVTGFDLDQVQPEDYGEVNYFDVWLRASRGFAIEDCTGEKATAAKHLIRWFDIAYQYNAKPSVYTPGAYPCWG
jgi:hypothetical protein